MANFLNIKLTNTSESTGPYIIYYDTISPGTIAINSSNNLPATNLTLSQLQFGVNIQVPDPTTKVILYNTLCKNFQEFDVDPISPTFPCLCVIIFNNTSGDVDKIEGCFNNKFVNGKPLYEGPQSKFVWVNNRWEMSGFTKPGATFISNDIDEIPNSLWLAVGQNAANYTLTVQEGSCASVTSNSAIFIASGVDASCNDNDGSIVANAIGGTPPWTYSRDGILPYVLVGIFQGLSSGNYLVHAKDSDGNILVENVAINHPPINFFSIEATSIQPSTLSKVGNVQYYSISIPFDTSEIPVGQSVVFDFEIIYTLKYNGPGYALFETDQNNLNKNGVPIPVISLGSQPFVQIGSICVNYFTYGGNVIYGANQISLSNGDLFSLNVVVGIDTQTGGNEDNGCRTEAFLTLTTSFNNVDPTCNCCTLNDNVTNISLPKQIFI